MKTSVDEFASVLEQLTEKVRELELRLTVLERRSSMASAPPPPRASPALAEAHPLNQISLAPQAGVMPAIGKVFLGLAGAYLLRAVAESGFLPRLVVVAAALVYAALWLVSAWRALDDAHFARTAYAAAAALILSPMLWEVTLRFRLLPAPVTAGVLAAFALLAWVLSWRRNLVSLVWVTTLATAVTALALLVATRDPAPFVLALLIMALAVEAAACRDRWLSLRPVVAAVGDLALMVVILVYTRQDGPPAEYQPIAWGVLAALLFAWLAIYAAGTVFRTAGDRHQISFFEIGQTMAAFLLVDLGVLRLGHGTAYAMGIACLVAAAGCYGAMWLRLEHLPRPRNFYVFAAWAVALLLAGSILCFPPPVLVIELGIAALAASLAGARRPGTTLALHAGAYLIAAAWVSGTLSFAREALLGVVPSSTSWPVWSVTLAAIACYGIAWRAAPAAASPSLKDRMRRLPWFFIAAIAVGASAALVVPAIALLAPGGATISEARLSVIRTFVIALAALAVAWGSSRGRRIELVWLAYTAIAFCTLKLLFEDLRTGSAGSIAASLFCYGMGWLLVPRLTRKNATGAEAPMA